METKNLVHGDLSARNVFLTKGKVAKVKNLNDTKDRLGTLEWQKKQPPKRSQSLFLYDGVLQRYLEV